MAKRKRDNADKAGALKSRKEDAASTPKQAARVEVAYVKTKTDAVNGDDKSTAQAVSTTKDAEAGAETSTFQIITGSYERVLHGFAATIPRSLVTGHEDATASEADKPKIDFTDTFLFNAHASAVRCLALSPLSEETSKITLATGATDERINLYSLSTAPPTISKNRLKLPSLGGNSITENPKNKELGSLLHHSSNITALYFPTRSKLLSAAEDSTIAITRTRDWTALSTIKAPIPKPQGRPSGDTAGPGEVPSGINDFAVHPSMKLMVSVGKGEKCMRLWNLVTGKKAGVLNFGREILSAVGEGRFGSGEGRGVIWDNEGEEFAVAFERGVVLFGIDSKPKAKILPTPKTKIHQMHYLPSKSHPNTLLVSTEDGRVLLYDTTTTTTSENAEDAKEDDIPPSKLIAQVGGPAAGISGRVKDFEVLPFSAADTSLFLIVTGSSDGTVRLWSLDIEELKGGDGAEQEKGLTAKQVGHLLGTYSTGTRITCLKSFAMTGTPDKEEEEEVEIEKDVESSSDEEGA
ncbi:WD40 repeat-like protein [Dothidotthia symphoricarpi CBS 119687]|uniref:WD40 repeat-like protein n=1 Tax=Dothidotthia symphoricarpi CBS 119687 TaxID=1392245 RepID=A0A6A6APX2_9PLEO|nr:WD40 repeat-like protein [Dothidotthia symphoricarpi CBS 119687]KAF2133969.1 WD40 repeat-like protein [Dothidotthia symphoricarpi CBS 119687]